jgi:hypothetical protein
MAESLESVRATKGRIEGFSNGYKGVFGGMVVVNCKRVIC